MWPDAGVSSSHLDSGADRPASARTALLAALQALIKIVDSRGQADGVCDLDDNGKVPDVRLGKGMRSGVCDLAVNGRVPPQRYASRRTGAGLGLDNLYRFSHQRSASARSVNCPASHVVRQIRLDRFGHISGISTRFTACVERSGSTTALGSSSSYSPLPHPPADPVLPAVELPGTWQVVHDEIQTSTVRGSKVESESEGETNVSISPGSITKTRRVVYARV